MGICGMDEDTSRIKFELCCKLYVFVKTFLNKNSDIFLSPAKLVSDITCKGGIKTFFLTAILTEYLNRNAEHSKSPHEK